MDDAERASEKRPCTQPSTAEAIMSRLDQLDYRLRQLEEKQRMVPADCYFAADLQLTTPRLGHHQRANSLSAMHDAHLKAALMDRLHLLETRIRQLSSELDKETDAGAGGRGMFSEASGGCIHAAAGDCGGTDKNKDNAGFCSSDVGSVRSWKASVLYKSTGSGVSDLQSQKQLPTTNEVEKAAAGEIRRKERKGAERPRFYRRWLQVGC